MQHLQYYQSTQDSRVEALRLLSIVSLGGTCLARISGITRTEPQQFRAQYTAQMCREGTQYLIHLEKNGERKRGFYLGPNRFARLREKKDICLNKNN